MYRLIAIGFIILLSACGTTDNQKKPEAEPANGQASENDNSGGNGIVAGELQLKVVSFDKNQAVIELQNQTEHVQELEFSSGQQYDMWIKDEDGNEVYHWGKDKMFTQALKTITLKQAEKVSFKVSYPQLDPGTYKVRFKVTSKPSIEKTFELKVD